MLIFDTLLAVSTKTTLASFAKNEYLYTVRLGRWKLQLSRTQEE